MDSGVEFSRINEVHMQGEGLRYYKLLTQNSLPKAYTVFCLGFRPSWASTSVVNNGRSEGAMERLGFEADGESGVLLDSNLALGMNCKTSCLTVQSTDRYLQSKDLRAVRLGLAIRDERRLERYSQYWMFQFRWRACRNELAQGEVLGKLSNQQDSDLDTKCWHQN